MTEEKEIHLNKEQAIAWQHGWDKGYKAGYNQCLEDLKEEGVIGGYENDTKR